MLFDLPNEDTLYDALIARSSDYEGLAYVCVRTTGVFCRFTCPARKPKRENTLFYDSIATCMQSGFRPCRRCKPLEQAGKEPIVDELLEALDCAPATRWTEDDLVRKGYEPSTVRRAFKRSLGMTFLDIARSRRLGEAARRLRSGARVIDVQLDAGYELGSGFRAAFQRLIGKAPAMSQNRELLFADWFETPLGPMVAVADQTHLHLLELHDRKALQAELENLQRKTRSSVAAGRTPDRTDRCRAASLFRRPIRELRNPFGARKQHRLRAGGRAKLRKFLSENDALMVIWPGKSKARSWYARSAAPTAQTSLPSSSPAIAWSAQTDH